VASSCTHRLPIGKHVFARVKVDGETVIRSYTPVTDVDTLGYFDLVLKIYTPLPPRFVQPCIRMHAPIRVSIAILSEPFMRSLLHDAFVSDCKERSCGAPTR
jgi:hypothetical protein